MHILYNMNKSQNQNAFSIFHSHKIHPLALFTDQNDRFPTPSLMSEKGTTFRRSLPV